MTFDESKDKVLGEWQRVDGTRSVLVMSVRQYNGGEVKLQIGPRQVLSLDEWALWWAWLQSISGDIDVTLRENS